MDLPNIKELEKLLKMCRKQGVTDLSIGDVVVKFGDLPQEPGKDLVDADGVIALAPTDEELAYWSSAPDPLAVREGAEQ